MQSAIVPRLRTFSVKGPTTDISENTLNYRIKVARATTIARENNTENENLLETTIARERQQEWDSAKTKHIHCLQHSLLLFWACNVVWTWNDLGILRMASRTSAPEKQISHLTCIYFERDIKTVKCPMQVQDNHAVWKCKKFDKNLTYISVTQCIHIYIFIVFTIYIYCTRKQNIYVIQQYMAFCISKLGRYLTIVKNWFKWIYIYIYIYI